MAALWPSSLRGWCLKRDQDDKAAKFTAQDETQPLYAIGVRADVTLVAAEDAAPVDKAAAAETKKAKKARAALKPIRITVTTNQGVQISIHRLDQSTPVSTLLQQLRDGTGEVNDGCYSSFARGVAPYEQRLYIDDSRRRYHKRLLPQNTLADYQLRNGSKVKLTWYRDGAVDKDKEAEIIELRVQPLVNDKLPYVLLDVERGATVQSVKEQLASVLPGYSHYRKLPIAQCHLYFPLSSAEELSKDDRKLSAIGIGGKADNKRLLGVRFENDEKVKVEEADEDAEEEEEEAEVEEQDEEAEADNGKDESGAEAAATTSGADATAHPMDADDGKQGDRSEVKMSVTIDGRYGPSLTITVKPSTTTVRELKERMEAGQVDEASHAKATAACKGVPVAQQQLVSVRSTKTLNDFRTLSFYGLTNTHNPLVWSRKAATDTEQGEAGRATAATGRGRGRGKRQRASTEQAANSASSSSSSTSARATIELSLRRLYGGKRKWDNTGVAAVDCPPTQTIGELRQRIAEHEHNEKTDKVRVRRTAAEPPLSDQATLAECGFTDGDTVVVDFCTLVVGVTLVLPSGGMTCFYLYGDGRATVGELKQRVAARADGYPVEWQWAELIVEAESGRNEQWVEASVDDDKPMAHYASARSKTDADDELKAYLLICRRAQPQPKQHNERELAAQPDQRLRLRVNVAATNDIYEVSVMAWQPLLAVKWHLTWMTAATLTEPFYGQRLSLCPLASLSSPLPANRRRTAASRPRFLNDDYAPLQSLGVSDGSVLQLDRSEVALMVEFEQEDTVVYDEPIDNEKYAHGAPTCAVYAQLNDTNAQLKAKIQSLAAAPADRQFFFFDRPLSAEVDDSITLAQLGFTARRRTNDECQDGSTTLHVRLLPHPAQQPPSAEQQCANGILHVGVRVLAAGRGVHRVYVFADEPTKELRRRVLASLQRVLQSVDAQRNWNYPSVALACGGRRADDDGTLAALLADQQAEQPIIDVLILQSEQPRGQAGDDDAMEEDEGDEGNEDGDEEADEAEEEQEDEDEDEQMGGGEDENDEDDAPPATKKQKAQPAAAVTANSKPVCRYGAACYRRNPAHFAEFRHPHLEQADKTTAHKAESSTPAPAAVEDEDTADGVGRFCLHPQHPLRLMKPYVTRDKPRTEWFCDVCSNGHTLTPDNMCWHCVKCGYDVCNTCFDRASAPLSDEGGDEQTAEDGRRGGGEASGEQSTGADKENATATETEPVYHTSAKYAWLPTDFHVEQDGSVRCLSYINNLHPAQHAVLYPLLERVVARFIPLFERVLTSLRHQQPEKVPVGSWYDDDEEAQHEAEVAAKLANVGEDEDGDEFDEDDAEQEWEDTKPIHQPDVPPFTPPIPPPTTVSLRNRRLQLIIKLADIVLTPQQPHYAGGVWHVEGMRNECIVASGIAYYDQSNIGPSSLAFRTAVSEPAYEQNDNRGIEAIYGLKNEEALVQSLGADDTCNGRCIAFPNIYQHRVAPFSLIDPTRPGHRSILVAFLVDPAISVISTSRVPPQQKEWMGLADSGSALTDALAGTRVLSELVAEYVDWPMERAEAEQHRERLMHERKYFVKESTKTVFEREFSLCEH